MKILSMIKDKITFIHVGGFYDHPLNGWLKVNSHYHYFEIIEDNWVCESDLGEPEELEWGIYKFSRHVTLEHLKFIRQCRLIGGWHWDYDPHKKKKRGEYKSTFNEIYKLPKPISSSSIPCEMIGVTIDLKWMYPY